MNIKKMCVFPMVLLSALMVTGCSVDVNKNINESEIQNESLKVETENNIEKLFSGVWVRKNENTGENLYLKIREDKYEYHTNKECYLTYESIENVNMNEEGIITLDTITHDEQGYTTYVKMLNKDTMLIGNQEDNISTEYKKLTDKEFAKEDLNNAWAKAFYVHGEEGAYSVEEFLEIEN